MPIKKKLQYKDANLKTLIFYFETWKLVIITFMATLTSIWDHGTDLSIQMIALELFIRVYKTKQNSLVVGV